VEALTRQDVEDIARLARLELDGDEIERLRVELAAILHHMVALRDLDMTGVEPMTHAVPMQLRLREDIVGESLPVDVALAQAPDRDQDCFRVPNILPTSAAG
jgi:aspartyl-tRNA(Asn)/glutamyl-tRNA(Gln) amidotransferase subunit C